jgi:hypothetical protein
MTTERKKLLFATGHLENVLAGKKQITIRKYRRGAHDFVEGEIVDGVFEDGPNGPTTLPIQITCTPQILKAGHVPDGYCRADGFQHREDMIDGMARYYPDFDEETEVALILFVPAEAGQQAA